MTEPTSRFQNRRRRLYVGVAILLAVELVRLGGQLLPRIAFPWDTLTVFESPHMVALAKLRAGEPLYGPAADANSEPYPPFAACLTYAVLRPLGLELDVRGARAVAVGVTLFTALVAAAITRRVLLSASVAPTIANRTPAFIAGAALLMLHKSLTSDQPHPDNLHVLHATVLLYLGMRAVTRGRTSDWVVAALWGAIGVLMKQTAAFAPAAVGAMLLASRSLDRRAWLFAALTLLVGGAVTGALLSDPYRDFHLRGALGAHAIDWSRVDDIVFSATPTRVFPRFLALIVAGFGVFRFRHAAAWRPFLTAWCAIGFFEVLPAAAGFLKIGGNHNNLGIIDFWLFLMIAPQVIWDISQTSPKFAVRGAIFACWFLAALWPAKLVPNDLCYRFGHDVEHRVRDDIAHGRRVWLNLGVVFQFRAGDPTPPRDLAIALWTLDASAEKDDSGPAASGLREGIKHRLAVGEYDRIYDFFPWAIKTRDRLEARYEQTEIIRGAGYGSHHERHGIQPLMNRCTVYAKKPN